MKKSLLLLASLLVAVSSFAQWTKPVPKAEASFKYTTFAAEEGDTAVYYLYNKDAQAFFTEGNAWGTQASFADKGLKVAIEKYIPTDGVWDEQTVFIWDYSLAKKAWKKLFIDSETAMFVDLGNQANFYWSIEDMGSGVFRLYGADLNPAYNSEAYGNGAKAYMGVSGYIDEGASTLSPLLTLAEDPDAKVDWQFVSEEAYEEYLPKLAIYAAAVKLGDAIERAKNDYSLNTSAAEAVYNNTSSSLEELQAAYDEINDAIKKAEFGDASEDNPKDCTEWLENADFSQGNANGWTVTFKGGTNATNVGYQSANYSNGDVSINQFIEAWANAVFSSAISTRAIGVGELSQTIKNMPQGKYMLGVDCIANNQDGFNPVVGVQLFATGGSLDVYETIATGNGAPEHFELTFVNDGDDITMGLRTTTECTANWIAADNFTLTYYGPTTEDPYKMALDAAIEKALQEIPLEDLEEMAAAQADKDAYKQAIENGQNATEDYQTYTDAIATAKKNLADSKTAYASYVADIEEVVKYMNEVGLGACDEADYLADYTMDGNEIEPDEDYPYGSYAYIMANYNVSKEDIVAEGTRISEILKSAIINGIKEGDDFTYLLVNPDFKDANGKGWTKAKGSPVMHGGLQSFPCAELWHATFDIYQDVTGVPDGIYSISLNGFCRLDNGQTEVPAYIYMNDFATRLMDIDGDILPKDQAVDGHNCYLTNGESSVALTDETSVFYGNPYNGTNDFVDTEMTEQNGYRPNSMQGASVAFSAGRYKATVYGLVEGGKMRIGVRNLTDNQVWALWSNFKLTYEGKSEEALLAILPKFSDELFNLVDTKSAEMTTPTVEAAQKALEQAEKATDGDAMYEALIAVNKAIVACNENIAALQAYNTAFEALGSAAEISENTAALDEYNANIDRFGSYEDLTTEQLNALIEEISNLTDKLNIPNTDGASDETPADMTGVIKNADFQADSAGSQATGWTLVKGEGATGNYQIQTGYDGGVSMEFWSPTHGEGTQYNFYQRIKNLPAGTYTITCEASNSLNDQEAGEGEGAAYLYAAAGTGDDLRTVLSDPFAVQTEGCRDARGTYTVTIKLAEGEDLVIGSKNIGQLSARWVMIDNFTMEYYGANSAKEESPVEEADAIVAIAPNAAPVAIYTLSGTRANTLQKGLNIIRMENGTVKKVFVK